MKEAALKKELYREILMEVEAVLARAGEGADALREDALARKEALLEKGRDEIGREEERRKSRALAKARKEMRNRILEFRRAEVDRLFEAALESIAALAEEDAESYGELLWSFFRSGKALMPPGPLRVLLGQVPEGAARRIGSAGDDRVECEDGWQGLQMETLDGRMRCDYRLPGLLCRFRQEREAEIEELLFEVHGEP